MPCINLSSIGQPCVVLRKGAGLKGPQGITVNQISFRDRSSRNQNPCRIFTPLGIILSL